MNRAFSVSITPKMMAGEMPRTYASRTANCAMESARAESTCLSRMTSLKKFRFSAWNFAVAISWSTCVLSFGAITPAMPGACFRNSSPSVPPVE